MGILSNTVSICQFRVTGALPEGDLYQWSSDRLAENAFKSIDNTAQELSLGWVHVDDMEQGSFDTPRAFWRDNYTVFTLRRDQRKAPSVLLKAEMAKAESEFLAANPTFKRVPKGERDNLRDRVRASLFSRILPSPTTYDALWDRKNGIVTFTSLSPKTVDLFEDLFRKTFVGLRLVMIHPLARGEMVLDDETATLLKQANRASSEDVVSLIKENTWLGMDFMRWLMYKTMEDSSEYEVNRPGHFMEGEPYVAYINDRLILKGASERGVQKISVAGPQDNFSEVRTAVRLGKEITEATIYLEREEEESWKLTLKGEMFHFASLKSPAVRIEKDEVTDEGSEREAVFYERMYLLEKGLQLFDSLYADFLRSRLGSGWAKEAADIEEWLASDDESSNGGGTC
ncbi:MAG: recombination-associated protein RdgC [Proteobacteria bacterium]|nr:recombination-associated protein RdgC [Pseudomonadota bacterium]